MANNVFYARNGITTPGNVAAADVNITGNVDATYLIGDELHATNVFANTIVAVGDTYLKTDEIKLGNNFVFVTSAGNTAVGGGNTTPATKLYVDGNYSIKNTTLGTSNYHAINCAAGCWFGLTGIGATTISFTNAPANVIYMMVIRVTGGSALTWSNIIQWPGASAPSKSSNTDLWGFMTENGGTNWRGLQIAKDVR